MPVYVSNTRLEAPTIQIQIQDSLGVNGGIYLRWNGLDLSAKLLLYPVEVEPILERHKVDAKTKMAKPA